MTELMPNTLVRLCFCSFDSKTIETVCKLSDCSVALWLCPISTALIGGSSE